MNRGGNDAGVGNEWGNARNQSENVGNAGNQGKNVGKRGGDASENKKNQCKNLRIGMGIVNQKFPGG